MKENVPGTKLAERLLTRPAGATMAEIIAETGGPQYNLLKRLEARGYAVRKVKEGSETRYLARPPLRRTYAATVTGQGQITVPKELRERLRLRAGGEVQLTVESDDRVVMTPAAPRLSELTGILGKPKRHVTIEEMNEGIGNAIVERYRRAVARPRRGRK